LSPEDSRKNKGEQMEKFQNREEIRMGHIRRGGVHEDGFKLQTGVIVVFLKVGVISPPLGL